MSKPNPPPLPLTAKPVFLAAHAINHLVRTLPAGTAYFIGIVLITMLTGQLVHHQGSLARAALPYVLQLRWGWHRVERALEFGGAERLPYAFLAVRVDQGQGHVGG